MSDELLKTLGLTFVVFITICGIVEIAFLVHGFMYADKVECNLIFCEFTYGEGVKITNITSSRVCYENGEEVNCSQIGAELNVKQIG